MFKEKLKAFFVLIFYRFFLSTWKLHIHETDEFQHFLKTGEPFILAHWHGDELALLYLVKKYRLATMISKSKDGALMNTIYRSLGGATTRGSSSKGAISALKALIRLMVKKKHPTSIAVDGPRGPIYHVKPGVFELSRLTGAPIFSVGVFVKKKFTFQKSWNQAILPYLFSHIHIFVGLKTDAISRKENPRSEELAKELHDQLFNARRQASKLVEIT